MSFGPALTSVPINQLTMQFEGNAGRQSDAYAFAQNLGIWHDQLVDAALTSAIIRNEGPFDDFLDCQPMRTVRLAWDGSGGPESTHLFKSHFWESSNACGDAPDNQGSIRSAVIYDRGECARVEELQPRLTNIVQRSWNELANFFFKSGANPGLNSAFDNLVRHMFRASSYVRPGPGAPTDVRGGFVLAAAIEASTADFLPVNDVEVQAVLDFELGLDADGLLEVNQDVVFINVDGGGLFGDPISHAAVQAFIEDQVTGQVDTINAEARAAQFVDLQPESTTTCNGLLLVPNAHDQCFNTYVNPLIIALSAGVANQQSEGIEAYSDDEFAAMVSAIDDPARWSCGGEGDSRCMFSVPGKRLNIHPQAVEIVWFDGKEVDSPAYALWVAAHAATGQDRREAIGCCAPTRSSRPLVPMATGCRSALRARASMHVITARSSTAPSVLPPGVPVALETCATNAAPRRRSKAAARLGRKSSAAAFAVNGKNCFLASRVARVERDVVQPSCWGCPAGIRRLLGRGRSQGGRWCGRRGRRRCGPDRWLVSL